MRIINCFALILLTSFTIAQTTYEVEPGLKNNLFELSISSGSDNQTQSTMIFVQEKPDWISFKTEEVNFNNVSSREKQTSQFFFDVLKYAPIGEEGRITFKITSSNGSSVSKIYNLKVISPKSFEVQQNYPNPFNPSTIIRYSIPQDAFVSIKVFNVLGEQVSELINKEIKTGIHEVTFNADNLSSGFYFYVVEARGADGEKYFDSKKMTLLK